MNPFECDCHLCKDVPNKYECIGGLCNEVRTRWPLYKLVKAFIEELYGKGFGKKSWISHAYFFQYYMFVFLVLITEKDARAVLLPNKQIFDGGAALSCRVKEIFDIKYGTEDDNQLQSALLASNEQ